MATAVKSNGKPESLSDKHARLIEQYTRTTGAAKAQVARQIGEVQVDLRLAGESYTPWEKPSDYRRSWELSESQLRDQIRGLRSLVSDETVEPATRAAGERRLERFIAQAEKRGVSVS
jgi:hypothetical protein